VSLADAILSGNPSLRSVIWGCDGVAAVAGAPLSGLRWYGGCATRDFRRWEASGAGAAHNDLCDHTPWGRIMFTSDGAVHGQFQPGGVNIPGMRRATYRVQLVIVGAAFLALLGLIAVRSAGAQQSKPLNEKEVVELLEGGVPSGRVTELVNERGIAFEFTAASEQRIRNAGGADELVTALRRASQHHAQSEQPRNGGLRIQSTPGETQVYLNDEPKGMTSREGEIRLPDLKPGTYNVRVSLLGYQSWENSVTVETGEVQTLYVTLVKEPGDNPVKGNPAPVQPVTPNPSVTAGIPVPGIKVSALQFFEGPHETTLEKSQRVYRFSFDAASTRSVYWVLDLTYPNPSQRIDFKLDANWYKADGSEMTHQTMNGYVKPEWKNSWHTLGFGWVDAGHWTRGTYRVDLFCQGTRVASGTFQIN